MPLCVSSLACTLCFATINSRISGHCLHPRCRLLVICYTTVNLPTLRTTSPALILQLAMHVLYASRSPILTTPSQFPCCSRGTKKEEDDAIHNANACPFWMLDSLLLQEESPHHPKGRELCCVLSSAIQGELQNLQFMSSSLDYFQFTFGH